MAKRLLISGLGHNDLRPMAAAQPAAKRKEILDAVRGEAVAGEMGPIKTLLEQETFDRVVLLSNFKPDWSRRYAQWLDRGPGRDNQETVIAAVKIASPTDYETIFRAADGQLAKLRTAKLLKTHELCIHLGPGTPAMAAVWLLLGKSKYPATFYQTYQGKSWVTDVPFDLAVDFLPDFYAASDTQLQHLAAKSPGEIAGFEGIVGDSRPLRTAVGRARRAAIRGVSVLLLGESGSGKEMFAQAIHKTSPRAKGPFVPINCAAIARELLESELFGHKKGAFTGAERDRTGAFAEADGGTLFLDEIGECDLDLQAKLLRVLQPPSDGSPCHRTFRPVGSSRDQTSNVRVVAATNRDLVQSITVSRFREDLYYRLAVITINLPALRERKTDIPKTAQVLLDRINRQLAAEGEPGYRHKTISAAAMSFVKQRPWPGNVRQLYNVLLQAAVMTDGDQLERPDIAAALGEMPQLPGEKPDAMDRPLGEGFLLAQNPVGFSLTCT